MRFPFALPEWTARDAIRRLAIAILVLAQPATAQVPADRTDVLDGFSVVAAEGRELFVLPVPGSDLDDGQGVGPAQSETGRFAARSFETATHRIHVVSLDGASYSAATPRYGPRSWIVFDPARRAFVSLLPSIRVELGAGVRPQAVADALGSPRVTEFESLRFAIIDLPADLHPADAVARVSDMPGSPDAAVRLRGARIEWK